MLVDRLEHLDLDDLYGRGRRGLLLDLDNTLCPWGSREVPPARRAWVQRARERFSVCIISNTIRGHRLNAVGADLGLPTVARWGLGRKPFPGGIRAALRLTGTRPEESAIVGDQIFADILGGNCLGLLTVWSLPLATREFPTTRCVRHLERVVLRKLGCVLPRREEERDA